MWSNLPKIVESFKGHDRPGYALAAIIVIALLALTLAALGLAWAR